MHPPSVSHYDEGVSDFFLSAIQKGNEKTSQQEWKRVWVKVESGGLSLIKTNSCLKLKSIVFWSHSKDLP